MRRRRKFSSHCTLIFGPFHEVVGEAQNPVYRTSSFFTVTKIRLVKVLHYFGTGKRCNKLPAELNV